MVLGPVPPGPTAVHKLEPLASSQADSFNIELLTTDAGKCTELAPP
jgi:hypothetical protein